MQTVFSYQAENRLKMEFSAQSLTGSRLIR
jgi:hypothetical protein